MKALTNGYCGFKFQRAFAVLIDPELFELMAAFAIGPSSRHGYNLAVRSSAGDDPSADEDCALGHDFPESATIWSHAGELLPPRTSFFDSALLRWHLWSVRAESPGLLQGTRAFCCSWRDFCPTDPIRKLLLTGLIEDADKKPDHRTYFCAIPLDKGDPALLLIGDECLATPRLEKGSDLLLLFRILDLASRLSVTPLPLRSRSCANARLLVNRTGLIEDVNERYSEVFGDNPLGFRLGNLRTVWPPAFLAGRAILQGEECELRSVRVPRAWHAAFEEVDIKAVPFLDGGELLGGFLEFTESAATRNAVFRDSEYGRSSLGAERQQIREGIARRDYKQYRESMTKALGNLLKNSPSAEVTLPRADDRRAGQAIMGCADAFTGLQVSDAECLRSTLRASKDRADARTGFHSAERGTPIALDASNRSTNGVSVKVQVTSVSPFWACSTTHFEYPFSDSILADVVDRLGNAGDQMKRRYGGTSLIASRFIHHNGRNGMCKIRISTRMRLDSAAPVRACLYDYSRGQSSETFCMAVDELLHWFAISAAPERRPYADDRKLSDDLVVNALELLCRTASLFARPWRDRQATKFRHYERFAILAMGVLNALEDDLPDRLESRFGELAKYRSHVIRNTMELQVPADFLLNLISGLHLPDPARPTADWLGLVDRALNDKRTLPVPLPVSSLNHEEVVQRVLCALRLSARAILTRSQRGDANDGDLDAFGSMAVALLATLRQLIETRDCSSANERQIRERIEDLRRRILAFYRGIPAGDSHQIT